MAQINIKQIRGASQGSLVFLGTNSTLSENYSRLNWNQNDNVLTINGKVGIGTDTPTSSLYVKSTGTSSSFYSFKVDDGDGNPLLHVRDDGFFSVSGGRFTSGPNFDNLNGSFTGTFWNCDTTQMPNSGFPALNIGINGSSFLFADLSNNYIRLNTSNVTIANDGNYVGNDARVVVTGTLNSKLGVRHISFLYRGDNGLGAYALGNEADNLNNTIRFYHQPTQFGYTDPLSSINGNNSYRIGIGTSSVSSHRVVISDGLKLISTPYNSNSFEIQTSAGTPSFNVQNNGNVGIGTSTPNHKLSIDGPANTTLYLNSSGANGAIIVDSLVYPIFQLRTNTVPDITIQGNSSGNSLIDIPTSLQVREAASTITRFGFADMNTNPHSYFRLNLAVGAQVIPSASLHVKGIGTNSGTYSLKVDDGVGNPLLYVRDDGFASFGNSPDADSKYYFYANHGSTLKTLKVYHNAGLAGSTAVEFGSVGATLRFLTDNNFWSIGTSDDYPFYLFQNSNRVFSSWTSGGTRLLRLGEVDTPNATIFAKLKVIGSNSEVLNLWNSSGVNLSFSRSDGTGTEQPTAKIYSSGSGSGASSVGQLELYGYDTTYNKGLTVLKNGDVEITNLFVGTTSTSSKLHIYSSSSGAFRLQDTSQSLGYILVSDANGVGTWTSSTVILSAISGVTGSGTTNYVPKWNSISGLSSTSSIYIDANNDVGIGSTNPTNTKLLIVGSNTQSSTYGLRLLNSNSTNEFYFRNDGLIQHYNNHSSGVNSFQIYNNSTGIGFAFQGYYGRLSLGASNTTTNATLTITDYGTVQNFINFDSDGSKGYITGLGGGITFVGRQNSSNRFVISSDDGWLGNNGYRTWFKGRMSISDDPVATSSMLYIKGIGTSSATYSLKIDDSAYSPLFYVNDAGNVGISNANPTASLHIKYGDTFTTPKDLLHIQQWYLGYSILRITDSGSSFGSQVTSDRGFWTFRENIGVGMGADGVGANRVSIKGNTSTNSTAALIIQNSSDNYTFTVLDNGNVGVGLVNATTKLHVYSTTSGALRLQDGTEGLNRLLVSNSTGVGTWVTASNLNITSKYQDIRGFTASIAESFTHNLNTEYVVVQCYDSSGLQIIPGSIQISGTASVQITMSVTLVSVKTIIIG